MPKPPLQAICLRRMAVLGESSMPTIDIDNLIDRQPISAFQWTIAFLCTVVLVVDGFDAQAIGYVAPALIKDLGFQRTLLGPIFTAGLAGLALGAIGLGVVADKIGRKTVLIASLVLFGLFTLAKGASSSFGALVALQFLAGLFMGGAYPCAAALASEYIPRRRRNMVVTAASLGFLVGTVVGGILSAALIPHLGWRSIFAIGGLAPIVLAAVCLVAVPSSVTQLINWKTPGDKAVRLLRRALPGATLPDDAVLTAPVSTAKSPVSGLFLNDRAIYTVLIWLTIFMVLITTHFVFTWLPTLFATAGLSIVGSVWAATAFPIGSAISSLVLTAILKRGWAMLALTASSILYGVALASAGTLTGNFTLLVVAVFLAGIGNGVIGATMALNVAVYPAMARSTGVGWAIGIGRIGSILGPLLGGVVVQLHWTIPQILMAAAVPAFIAACGTGLMWLLPSVRHMLTDALQPQH
jgi:AAHS family 4-hydroxybenzoate transporter-like MFS transporter